MNENDKDSFNYINITSVDGDHMDCFARQVPSLRYPVGDVTPTQMVVDSDAKRKISQGEELINLLEPIVINDDSNGNDICEVYHS